MEKELVVYICNTGFAYDAMEEARLVGAGGGTILHGRSCLKGDKKGMLGISISAEKDLVLIVTPKEEKHKIMNAINAKFGLTSEAKGIVFSMKVDDSFGMSFQKQIKDVTEVVI